MARSAPGWADMQKGGTVPNDLTAWTATGGYRLFGHATFGPPNSTRRGSRRIRFAGLRIRVQIIWMKHILLWGRGDYDWQHEPGTTPRCKISNWCGRSHAALRSANDPNPFGGSRPHEEATGHGTQNRLSRCAGRS